MVYFDPFRGSWKSQNGDEDDRYRAWRRNWNVLDDWLDSHRYGGGCLGPGCNVLLWAVLLVGSFLAGFLAGFNLK